MCQMYVSIRDIQASSENTSVCVVCEGREKKSVGTAQRAGRVSLTQSQVNADDMQSALTTALVSQSLLSQSACVQLQPVT